MQIYRDMPKGRYRQELTTKTSVEANHFLMISDRAGRLDKGVMATGMIRGMTENMARTATVTADLPRRLLLGAYAGALLAMMMAWSLVLGIPGVSAQDRNEVQFTSTRAAFEQGIHAYRAGYFEIAVPALKYAAARKSFIAEFYLARIYADPSSSLTDHAKAYNLYIKIVQDNFDIDPDVNPRYVFVAKALTELARYVRTGVEAANVRADPVQAALYLRQSANTFGDQDAQFELAKLYLRGEGVRKDVGLARHYLSVLTRKNHAAAQAFLADLMWRGKYIARNRVKALALIRLATTNAPDHERIWIEDIYQNIFCGSSKAVRKQSNGLVATWGKKFGRILPKPRPRTSSDQMGLGMPSTTRTCSNGEPVQPADQRHGDSHDLRGRGEPQILAEQPTAPDVMRGNAAGFSMRTVGAKGRR